MGKFVACLRLCRLEHWLKNALVFLPPFFLGVMFRPGTLGGALPAFLSFSCAASAIYVLNDLHDAPRDRLHPTKRHRPLAAGVLPAFAALALAAGLILAACAFVPQAHQRVGAAVTLFAYLLCNAAYTFRFKDTPLVDIFILASGFVFRIFYGGFFFGVPISSWMFLCVFSAALYFACGKRRNELKLSGTRPVLRFYTRDFLNAHYYMFCGLSILFYCLWTITRTDQHAVGRLALSIPFLIFILVRYNLIVDDEASDGDPVPVLLHDRLLQLSVAAFVLINLAVLYFGPCFPRLSY